MTGRQEPGQAITQLRHQRAALQLERSALVFAEMSRKYDPNQPRVPAGGPGGGQWGVGGAVQDAINRFAAITRSWAAYPPEQALRAYNALTATNSLKEQPAIVFGLPIPPSIVPGVANPLVHVGDFPR